MRKLKKSDFRPLSELIGQLPDETQAAIAADLKLARQELHLRELRKQLGKTQVDLSASSGISQAEISRIERNPETSQIRTLERYLDGLGGSLRLIAEFPDGSQALIPVKNGRPVKSRVSWAQTPVVSKSDTRKRA
jgi:predicted transcriptional regulator